MAQPREVCIRAAAAAHLPPGKARFLLPKRAPGTEPCLSVLRIVESLNCSEVGLVLLMFVP